MKFVGPRYCTLGRRVRCSGAAPQKILGFGLEPWVFFILGTIVSTIVSVLLHLRQKRPKTLWALRS